MHVDLRTCPPLKLPAQEIFYGCIVEYTVVVSNVDEVEWEDVVAGVVAAWARLHQAVDVEDRPHTSPEGQELNQKRSVLKRNCIMSLQCKKMLAIFPSPAGMSLSKAGNN